MRAHRHQKLGIKQTIQRTWMDKTVHMMLAGMSEEEIRVELDSFLSNQKQSGGIGPRGKQTYGLAISILAAWFAPEPDLLPFRDDALELARTSPPEAWLPLHWAILSAAYPFWFHVAWQIGRILNLQELVSQAQIFNRLKEKYGDRETVARNARYAVRSFVAWEVIQDSQIKGCYEKSPPFELVNPDVAALLIESALLSIPESKVEVGVLMNHPAFFPFQLPSLSGDFISQRNQRIEVMRFGLDQVFLKLI